MSPYDINPRLLKAEPMQRCSLGTCKAACCLYGVWMDSEEVTYILGRAEIIAPHMEPAYADPTLWLDGRTEGDIFAPTRVVKHSAVVACDWHYGGSACIFIRRDFKCALQVAAEAQGYHPWKYKPFYCILHPLDLDSQGRLDLDQTHLLLEEEGSCLVPADQPIPLLVTFEPELRYLMGDEVYEDLLRRYA